MSALLVGASIGLPLAAAVVLTVRTEQPKQPIRDADPHAGTDFQARFIEDEKRNQWTQEP